MGRIWRLDTDRGAFAVKQFLWTEAARDDDLEFQLAVIDAGVLAPRPVVAPNGSVLATVGDDVVRVYEWVDLELLHQRPADDRTLEDVGATLARIHGLQWSAGGEPHPWYVTPVGSERWSAALDAVHRAGVPWASRLAAVLPTIAALDEVISAAPPRPLIRCHLDYNRSNLGRDPHGNLVVLDWENSGPGVAVREAAGALLDWATDDARVAVPHAMRRLADAYGGIDTADGLSLFATRASAWVHYVALVCEQVVDPATTEDQRRYATDDVDAMLRRPLTIANLEAALSALA